MKYLNLSEKFNPYNATHQIKFESFTFGGGEPHIKIDPIGLNPYDVITITHRITNMDDLGLLLVAVSALHEMGIMQIYLYLPYFPGGRQDRVMVKGEPFTVKIYADIINQMRFSGVEILDPHSDVTSALIGNCKVISNHDFVAKCFNSMIVYNVDVPTVIISPDAGSNKKIKDLMIRLESDNPEYFELVKCDKTREVSSGRITGFEVYSNDLKGKDCAIVDDICANGGTFIGLAQELREKGAEKIHLIVTHGEFGSKRVETILRLFRYFDSVWITDSLFTVDSTFYEAFHHYERKNIKNFLKQVKIHAV